MQTSPRRIESYLHENIPLSAAMGIRVEVASPELVLLAAPLGPNVNHHATVFGGSAAVLATLSAWTLLHLRLEQAALDADLLIQRSAVEYRRPIGGDFAAACRFTDERTWLRFRATLERRGRARMTLTAQLLQDKAEMAAFSGDFVALRAPTPQRNRRAAFCG